MVRIGSYAPSLAVVVEREEIVSEQVSFVVLEISVALVASSWNEGVPKTGDASALLHVGGVEIAVVVRAFAHIPCFSSELCAHLKASCEAEGKFLIVADAEETSLAVVERFFVVARDACAIGFCRSSCFRGERFVPRAVGEPSVGKVSFHGKPPSCARNGPEVGTVDAKLRDGVRIDALE